MSFVCCIAKSIFDHLLSTSGPNKSLERLSLALRSTIVSFGDQQLVTGFSVLIAGFLQLRQGLEIFHWHSVVNQAWFSTITHLVTLTAIRDEVHKSRRTTPLTFFRFLAMGVLIVVLIVAMYPMGFTTSESFLNDPFPTWCFYTSSANQYYSWFADSSNHRYNWIYYLLASGILIYTYFTRILWLQTDEIRNIRLLSKALDRFGAIKNYFLRLGNNRKRNIWTKILYKLFHSTRVVFCGASDLFSSKLWEVRNLLSH